MDSMVGSVQPLEVPKLRRTPGLSKITIMCLPRQLALLTSTLSMTARRTPANAACLVTGAPEQDCQACHLLPHSKGDAYISAISNLRAGDEAPVTEIGDIRNGVLLYKGLHDVLGDGKIAFMPTPNPYLLPEDIPSRDPLAAPPPTRRLTLQHIYPLVGPNLLIAPHNHDIRVISHNMEPSAYLMHFFYACAILQRWGKSSRVYLLDEDIQDAYYDCKTPFASPVEPKFPKQTHPTAGSSHHGATSSTENRSLSDVMDELLLLHSIWHSREPTDVPDVTGKVLSWLEEADQSHLASNSTAHIISS
ncbi:hypothetical protein C8F01DRAFT_700842 [Mycena amicta]|nr:hypothetical protein C8F01DRAFT_700842 [Mycena amicta]